MTCILLRLLWLQHSLFFVLYSLIHTTFFICVVIFSFQIFFVVLVSNNRVCLCFYNFGWSCGPRRMCALPHILSLFFWGAFVHCINALMLFGGASHRSYAFFWRGAWLYVTALRAVGQTLASVLRGGTQRLSLGGGLYCSPFLFPNSCVGRHCSPSCGQTWLQLVDARTKKKHVKKSAEGPSMNKWKTRKSSSKPRFSSKSTFFFWSPLFRPLETPPPSLPPPKKSLFWAILEEIKQILYHTRYLPSTIFWKKRISKFLKKICLFKNFP